jgi:NifU-like protein
MPKRFNVCRTALAASKLKLVQPDAIKKHFLNPRNVGTIADPAGSGEAASFACGGRVCVTLHVDAEKRIADAKFKAIGCQLLVASASFLTEAIKGKTTAHAAQLAQSEDELGERLLAGSVPARASECVALARGALLKAITCFSDELRDEWVGDEALICSCFGVSESEIEREIAAASLQTIEEVNDACNAGGGCRSCYSLIQDILDTHRREASLRS